MNLIEMSGGNDVLRNVLDRAIDELNLAQQEALSPTQAAEILSAAMDIALTERKAYTGAMNSIALYAHRTDLWRLAVIDGETPEEFRDWLRSFDMSAAWVSRLSGSSEMVNWLESEGIKADHLMAAGKISHLQAALPRLRERKEEHDLDGAEDIIDTVTQAKNREVVREQFAEHKAPWGRFARLNFDQYGDEQLLVVCATPDRLTQIMRQLSGRLVDDLLVSTRREENALEVIVHAD